MFDESVATGERVVVKSVDTVGAGLVDTLGGGEVPVDTLGGVLGGSDDLRLFCACSKIFVRSRSGCVREGSRHIGSWFVACLMACRRS